MVSAMFDGDPASPPPTTPLRQAFGPPQDKLRAMGMPIDTATAHRLLNTYTPDCPLDLRIGTHAPSRSAPVQGRFDIMDAQSRKDDIFPPLVRFSQPFKLDRSQMLSGDIELLDRGTGLGRRVVAGTMLLFREMGFTESLITAASKNGGYTWARFGFELQTPHPPIGVPERVRMLKRLMPELPWKDLEPHLAFNHRRDIWAVADFAHDVALPDFGEKMWAQLADPQLSTDMARNTLRAYRDRDTRYTPGKFLLAGNGWEGRFRFDDADQMARMEAYVAEVTPRATPVSALSVKGFS